MVEIAIIITDKFEDVEYTDPKNAFEREGHKITHIGVEKGSKIIGKSKGTTVIIDESIDNAKVDNYDALLIPGGYSPDKLRIHENAVKFVKDFIESGKFVFMICHGPQLLITAQVLEGRKITGYKSIIQDIKNAGAKFIDKEVVIDKNLVSSRNPGDIPAFIEASLKKLE